MIVAWHEVPGKASTGGPSRRVRYDQVPVRTPARIRPYPTGRHLWVAPSQALRARLRSHRPSGTKAIAHRRARIKFALMVRLVLLRATNQAQQSGRTTTECPKVIAWQGPG